MSRATIIRKLVGLLSHWLAEAHHTKPLNLESVPEREAYLLYLLGSTILSNMSNKCIDAVFLESLRDLDTLNEWSSNVMVLAFLYYNLAEATIYLMWVIDGCILHPTIGTLTNSPKTC